jgi:hypothetical protein
MSDQGVRRTMRVGAVLACFLMVTALPAAAQEAPAPQGGYNGGEVLPTPPVERPPAVTPEVTPPVQVITTGPRPTVPTVQTVPAETTQVRGVSLARTGLGLGAGALLVVALFGGGALLLAAARRRVREA